MEKETNELICDNCGKKLKTNDNVYFEKGYTYNACSLVCFTLLRSNVTKTSVKERLNQ